MFIYKLVINKCYNFNINCWMLFSGIMYSMAAFGPVCGFLLGAYLLSFHMDSLSSAPVLIGKIISNNSIKFWCQYDSVILNQSLFA